MFGTHIQEAIDAFKKTKPSEKNPYYISWNDEIESAKARGWEEGYKQGWEDAKNEFVFPYTPPQPIGDTTSCTVTDDKQYIVWSQVI